MKEKKKISFFVVVVFGTGTDYLMCSFCSLCSLIQCIVRFFVLQDVEMKQNSVTGFGTLRGQDNIGRFGRPSGSSHQDVTTDMNVMAAVQQTPGQTTRRRRLLASKVVQLEKKKRAEKQRTVHSTPNNNVIAIGTYLPKSTDSNVVLPPPLSQNSPLDAVQVVPDPVPTLSVAATFGTGGTPLVNRLLPSSFLETTHTNDDGGYIMTSGGGGGGGVPIQPSPVDLPALKSAAAPSLLETNNMNNMNSMNSMNSKGFTTPMFDAQAPTSTAMAPDVHFDQVNQIARAYGIQGSLRTDQLPTSLSVYGGQDFKDGSPMIPHGPGQVSNGRSEMVNHALCMAQCKESNNDENMKMEKLEKCLETCFITYGPHLYTTLPQTK